MIDKKIYIFIDESGKPEVYSAKGVNLVANGQATKFLILAAIRTSNQLLLQQKVTDFKASLLKEKELENIFSSAYVLDAFHTHNDYPEVRERFYKFISELDDLKIDIIVVEKLKCYPSLKESPGKMYGVMAGQLLKNICHQTEETEIIFSRKAIFQVFENKKYDYYNIIKYKIGKIQDICNKKYFTQSNPLQLST